MKGAIRQVRVYHGLSQTDFAIRLGVKQSTIFRWESGRTKPQPSLLRELIIMSPPNVRHVFEQEGSTTIAQVSLDRSKEAAVVQQQWENDWLRDPVGHLDDIHAAVQERLKFLYLRGKNGNVQDAKKLVGILKHII
ncbi:MAG TPA: helix-turn-helix transcriptional regulator [Terriglobia bacterium]|nr:helix-turn-helix transcriptional regulator [Terriglobia bacterium]